MLLLHLSLVLALLIAPSLPASSPSPAHDADRVTAKVLTWHAPAYATYFIVTLAPKGQLDQPTAKPGLRVFVDVPVTAVPLPTLPHGWQFDWRVDSCNPEGCAFGSIWTFTVK